MTIAANASIVPDFLKIEEQPVGVWQYGKTVYQVYRLTAPLPWRKLYDKAALVLIGPRGAVYLVNDHGPRYCLTFENFSLVTVTHRKYRTSTPFERARMSRKELAIFLPAVTV